MPAFHFDARKVWHGCHLDFDEFVKEAKVGEMKKFEILKKELMEINTKAAVVTGRYIAYQQMNGKIEPDSKMQKELDLLSENHDNQHELRTELIEKMKKIDPKFEVEKIRTDEQCKSHEKSKREYLEKLKKYVPLNNKTTSPVDDKNKLDVQISSNKQGYDKMNIDKAEPPVDDKNELDGKISPNETADDKTKKIEENELYSKIEANIDKAAPPVDDQIKLNEKISSNKTKIDEKNEMGEEKNKLKLKPNMHEAAPIEDDKDKLNEKVSHNKVKNVRIEKMEKKEIDNPNIKKNTDKTATTQNIKSQLYKKKSPSQTEGIINEFSIEQL